MNHHDEINNYLKEVVKSNIPLNEYDRITIEYKNKIQEVKNNLITLNHIKSKEIVYNNNNNNL